MRETDDQSEDEADFEEKMEFLLRSEQRLPQRTGELSAEQVAFLRGGIFGVMELPADKD